MTLTTRTLLLTATPASLQAIAPHAQVADCRNEATLEWLPAGVAFRY